MCLDIDIYVSIYIKKKQLDTGKKREKERDKEGRSERGTRDLD